MQDIECERTMKNSLTAFVLRKEHKPIFVKLFIWVREDGEPVRVEVNLALLHLNLHSV